MHLAQIFTLSPKNFLKASLFSVTGILAHCKLGFLLLLVLGLYFPLSLLRPIKTRDLFLHIGHTLDIIGIL